MNNRTDQQLLSEYADHHSEPAFGELVRRHIDFVHSAALRMVHDASMAQDVAQNVFLALAREAGRLSTRPVLSGWLHRTTQNLAANAIRSDVRRRAREEKAAVMNDLLSADPDATWQEIAPLLDTALGELNESDRDALLLRYFERKTAREMAHTLGISNEAAQRRVSRAVERLREAFTKRGVTVGANSLAVVLSAQAVQSAPAGLAALISTAAVISGTTYLTTAAATTTNAIAMTTLQKTLIGTLFVVAVGAVLNDVRKSNAFEAKLSAQGQEYALLADQLSQSNHDRDEALQQSAVHQSKNLNDAAELIRMRSEVARLRRKLAEIAASRPNSTRLDATPKPDSEPTEPVQIFVANADARVPTGHTLAIGGWATAAGKRTIMLVKPTVVDATGNAATDALSERPGQIVLEGHIFEMPDEILDKAIADLHLPGMERLKTDGKATSSHSLFTSSEAVLLLKTLHATPGVELLSAPRVLTADGTQAIVSVAENKVVAGREHALGPSLDVEPRIAADGSSVNLTVVARLRKESSP